MLVDLATHFARVQAHKGLDICYVELLATAPWNRPKFSAKPKYKGVGRQLMATALSLSVDLEFKGRVGLHSLPESESWYPPLGFIDCGFDDAKKLQYFEMTEEGAALFFQTKEDER
jgi:hypothetical protein